MNISTANRLFELRKKSGLSQEQLAEKIGVSRQAVSKWERAEASPDTDNLVLLAKLYSVSLDELLLGDDERAEETAAEKNTDGDEGENPAADEGDGDNAAADEEQEEYVSFKNGIHVRDKDGAKVDIGFGGIHVLDKNGSEVHVDHHGVFVEDAEMGEKITHHDHIWHEKNKSAWYKFPYAFLMVAVFTALGLIFNIWYIAWLVFLTIPLYYSLADAVIKRNPNHFAYPVLCALVFLFCGLYFGTWHPSWVVFLSVPLYYGIINMFRTKK